MLTWCLRQEHLLLFECQQATQPLKHLPLLPVASSFPLPAFCCFSASPLGKAPFLPGLCAAASARLLALSGGTNVLWTSVTSVTLTNLPNLTWTQLSEKLLQKSPLPSPCRPVPALSLERRRGIPEQGEHSLRSRVGPETQMGGPQDPLCAWAVLPSEGRRSGRKQGGFLREPWTVVCAPVW